jgi:sec-independent protein translocase protein TatA
MDTLLFISTQEIFVILVIVVMLFGSKKIPELARGLGKGMRELKDASNDIRREIQSSATEIKKEVDKMDKDLKA